VPSPHADALKVGGAQPSPVNVNVNVNLAQHHNPGLQTNGARTAAPAYVPLSAGTNMSLKLPSRVARPSPLATHSVVAAQLAGPSPSRTNES
jgi:hypothetical protein